MKKKAWIIIAIAIVAIVASVVTLNLLSGSEAIPNGGNFTDNAPNNPASKSTPDNNRPPDTSNWISPGKVYVDNYEFGHAIDHQLEVHNGNSHPAEFTVDFRIADYTEEGYTRSSGDMRDWVWISERRPTLQPNETRLITIRLSVPTSANITADKWEFWIGVIDQSQEGNIWTELAQRWLVTMKE